MTSELLRLADIQEARARLDEEELLLIDRARHAGTTWARIAAALGVSSRQAAEQRRRRLMQATRIRRHALDVDYAPPIAALRDAVAQLQRWIDTDRNWDDRFRRAPLVRATVAAALQAAPGALHSLAAHLAADLGEARERELPLPVQAAAVALASALSTEH